MTGKPGWPLLLPDIARDPVLCHLGSSTSQFSLVVQCQDGWLHVFDLPTGSEPSPPSGRWPAYGFDDGNTRGRARLVNPRTLPDDPAEVGKGFPAIASVGPVPARNEVVIDLAGPSTSELEVQVLDVSGRLVRRLVAGSGGNPVRQIVWDGRNDRGERLPSGVYWCRLAGRPGDPQRIVVLH